MYYVIGASVSSLHRESTDSLIHTLKMNAQHVMKKIGGGDGILTCFRSSVIRSVIACIVMAFFHNLCSISTSNMQVLYKKYYCHDVYSWIHSTE